MSLYTCNHCNYTFSARSMPESCPDCGKTVATQVVSNGVYTSKTTVPAIRPATEMESIWFNRVQAELAQEDMAQKVVDRSA